MSTVGASNDDNSRPHGGGTATADYRQSSKKPNGRHGNNRKNNNNKSRENKGPVISKPSCGVCGLEDGTIKADPTEMKTTTTTSTGAGSSNSTSSSISVGGRPRPMAVVEVRYKCPKCLAPYCSVICYRQHKEVCPGKKETTDEANTTGNGTKDAVPAAGETTTEKSKSDNDGNDDDDDDIDDRFSSSSDDESLDEGWKITDDMKISLKNSTWLRGQLQDGGLRAMISDIVKADRKYKRHQRQQRQQERTGGRGRGRGRGCGGRGRGRGSYNHHNGSGGSLQRSGEDVLAAKRQENPKFDVFVDKVMIRAGVLERQQDDPNRVTRTNSNNNNQRGDDDDDDVSHEPIDKWLERPWVDAASIRHSNNKTSAAAAAAAAAYRLLDNSIERPFLTLKPIKKKRKVLPDFKRVDISSSDDDDDENEDENENEEDDDDDDDGSDNDSSNGDDDYDNYDPDKLADPTEEKESDDGSSSSSDDDEADEE